MCRSRADRRPGLCARAGTLRGGETRKRPQPRSSIRSSRDCGERSDRFFHHGDYETTTRINRLVVRMDPHFVEGLNTLAWLLRQGLNRPRMRGPHHRGLSRTTRSVGRLFESGALLFDLKEFSHWPCYYFTPERGAGALRPNATMLAHAYEEDGPQSRRLRAWRAIVEKFPGDEPARRNLGDWRKRRWSRRSGDVRFLADNQPRQRRGPPIPRPVQDRTFTRDLVTIQNPPPFSEPRVVAINEEGHPRYDHRYVHTISKQDKESYQEAAEYINSQPVISKHPA